MNTIIEKVYYILNNNISSSIFDLKTNLQSTNEDIILLKLENLINSLALQNININTIEDIDNINKKRKFNLDNKILIKIQLCSDKSLDALRLFKSYLWKSINEVHWKV
jgi:hypothetical protein